jgi:hypothetical protein
MTTFVWKITYTIKDEKGRRGNVSIYTAEPDLQYVSVLARDFAIALDSIVSGVIVAATVSASLNLGFIPELAGSPEPDADVEEKYVISLKTWAGSGSRFGKMRISIPTISDYLVTKHGVLDRDFESVRNFFDFFEIHHLTRITDRRGVNVVMIASEKFKYVAR